MHFIAGLDIEQSEGAQFILPEDAAKQVLADSLKSGKDQLWVLHSDLAKLPATLKDWAYSVYDFPLNGHSNSAEPEKAAYREALLFQIQHRENSLLAQVLDQSSSGILVFSDQGILLYANQKSEQWMPGLSHLPLGLLTINQFQWLQGEQVFPFSAIPENESLGIGQLSLNGEKLNRKLNLQHRVLQWKDQKFRLLELDSATELQRLHERLHQTEITNQLLLERSLGAYSLTNHENTITFLSGEVEKITGYQPEEIIGKCCLDLAHPKDRLRKENALNAIHYQHLAQQEVKYRLHHRNGRYRWVKATMTNHFDTPGIGSIVTVVQDIDEQERAQRDLIDSNHRFRWASRATKDVIWDWHYKIGKIEWGENLSEMYGWESHELDNPDKWLSHIPKEDHQNIQKSLDEAFEQRSETWECRYRFQKKNGEWAYILDRGYIERDLKGNILRIIGAMHDFSERHQYEQDLQKEKQKFRQLFEGSLIGVAMLELQNTRWQDCNQALLNMLGFKKSEFLAKSLADLIPESEHEFHQQKLRELRSLQPVKTYQTLLLRKDLGTTKVVVSAFTTQDEAKRPIAWFHFLDLGPVEESNRALVEAESRFRQYIEKASDIFVTLSKEGIIEYISPNILQLAHYRPTELIDKALTDYIHPKDLVKTRLTFIKAYRKSENAGRAVFRLKSKDGEWLWLEGNGRFQEREGKLKAFINIRDIRKEHEIESQLRKLSLVANRTSNGVLIVNANHEVEWLNQSFKRMSGYSLEEARGRRMEELLHGPASLKTDQGRLNDFLNSGKPFRLENINYKKDGSEYWVESIVTPIYDEGGRLVNYISIESDITERKQEELDFQRNLQLISEQNERLQSFAHIVSHNFRSHGSNIQQLIHELNVTQDQLLRDELYRYLEVSAEGLMQALDELSSILEVESASELPTEELNVLTYCERVRQILSRPTMEINAELQFDIPEGFSLKFYPAYLESVLFNLVSNALRYHDPEKDPWVKVWVEESENNKHLFVSDNGLGIDLEKYGDQLFKFKRSFHNHPDSSGIGLYLIRSQIESLGGEITVQSIVGKGTTFKVSLPK